MYATVAPRPVASKLSERLLEKGSAENNELIYKTQLEIW